ncbi:UNVERIFIED_CONTAM: hypothetical protein ACS92_06140 [Bacillus cereus]
MTLIIKTGTSNTQKRVDMLTLSSLDLITSFESRCPRCGLIYNTRMYDKAIATEHQKVLVNESILLFEIENNLQVSGVFDIYRSPTIDFRRYHTETITMNPTAPQPIRKGLTKPSVSIGSGSRPEVALRGSAAELTS